MHFPPASLFPSVRPIIRQRTASPASLWAAYVYGWGLTLGFQARSWLTTYIPHPGQVTSDLPHPTEPHAGILSHLSDLGPSSPIVCSIHGFAFLIHRKVYTLGQLCLLIFPLLYFNNCCFGYGYHPALKFNPHFEVFGE